MTCGNRTIAWAVQVQDKDGDDAGELAVLMCNEQLDLVRALIAREVGFAEAVKLHRWSNHELRETAKDYWHWAHKVPAANAPVP